jgi:integrative and conjugative element protein (TIGR02256 family)
VIAYPIGISGQQLILSSNVVDHLRKHRQKWWWQREAGGQIFARFNRSEILVERITGPRSADKRTRHTFYPHRHTEQREIEEYHLKNLHFVGDWHTHPESKPSPSFRDFSSITEMVARSSHALGGFVLLIVGQREPPDGFFVAICDGKQLVQLRPIDLLP